MNRGAVELNRKRCAKPRAGWLLLAAVAAVEKFHRVDDGERVILLAGFAGDLQGATGV